MKRLFILLAIGAVACTKQKPDWDQVTCKEVTYWNQSFTDSLHNISISDSVIISQKTYCTSDLHYEEVYKAERFGVKWEPKCDADGFSYCIKLYAIVTIK